MITAYYSPALAAFVNPNGQRHLLSVAAVAANLARATHTGEKQGKESITRRKIFLCAPCVGMLAFG
jgi:hypothetical protein